MVDALSAQRDDQPSVLLQLQDLDLDIQRAQRALDELPERRAILEVRAKHREVEGLGGKANLLVSRLEAELRRTQDEAESVEAKIAAEQDKIMSGLIGDHKQVQHISRELESLKKRKDKLETVALETMERIEKAAGQKLKVDEALRQLDAREAAHVQHFQEHGGELQTRIADEIERRARLAASLDPDLLARYDRLREQKAGIGVGRLLEGTCSACRVELPAGAISNLRGGPDINICPQCRRLIVVREGQEG
jgi:predicted  nucleic acid-binding Zn-ribbon protein